MNNYATFGQRFAAMWIDLFVFLPLMVIHWFLEFVSKGAALALVIPMATAYAAYTIYCHGRFGQTVGKRVVGIRVIRTTGERIGWREAWLRSSVELFFRPLLSSGQSQRWSPSQTLSTTALGGCSKARICSRISRLGSSGL